MAEAVLLEQKWADLTTLEAWRLEVVCKVEGGGVVQREPGPDPYKEGGVLASQHLIDELGHHIVGFGNWPARIGNQQGRVRTDPERTEVHVKPPRRKE